MLRLIINVSNSEIILVGPVDNVDELALELGYGIGSFPTSYLGLPHRSSPQGYRGLGFD